jgi:alpha-galactosidase
MKFPIAATVLTICTLTLPTLADSIRLEDLPLDAIHQDFGEPAQDKSVEGHSISIGGQPFAHGLGTHANMVWILDLGGNATRFTASIGLDDEVKDANASAMRRKVAFRVTGDHTVLYFYGSMKIGDAPRPIDLDVTGVHRLILEAETTGSIDYMHVDLAEPTITYSGDAPKPIEIPAEPAVILTPKPPATPRINGAKILGVRPGHPVLYTIAATGDRPMKFSAEGLPDGLTLDPDTGLITGNAPDTSTTAASDSPTTRESVVKLTATNSAGSDTCNLRIEVGNKIALTPPMGWNSWNCFAAAVTDKNVRDAADAMVNSGLINHGWTYINVDDTWEVKANEPPENRRASDGMILTNSKFPDMKAMADYIHSKGLRAGLYSSPGPSTCGGYTATYGFENADASQYAKWGFDYLKYDWCSYGHIADEIRKQPNAPSDLDIFQHPYLIMRDALLKQNRDILFSFCQYGMGDVWQWGEQAGGNCWRTTGDIRDSWTSMTRNGFAEANHTQYAGPGHWNDPDMLVVGKVGWGPTLHATHLTPNEQYTHISLWCLCCSPLLIGCDMTQLDDFTLNLLTNDEVLAVNQDPLGQEARRITATNDAEVWSKDMEDGTKAVGLFNRGELPQTVTVNWGDIGLRGKQPVRDLWRQKDLGDFDAYCSIEVPRHGVVLIKVGTPKQP